MLYFKVVEATIPVLRAKCSGNTHTVLFPPITAFNCPLSTLLFSTRQQIFKHLRQILLFFSHFQFIEISPV